MEPVVLQFEIEAAGKSFRVPLRRPRAPVHAVGFQGARNLAREASRQHDQTLGQLGEDFLVDARFVVEAVLVGGGEQPA